MVSIHSNRNSNYETSHDLVIQFCPVRFPEVSGCWVQYIMVAKYLSVEPPGLSGSFGFSVANWGFSRAIREG